MKFSIFTLLALPLLALACADYEYCHCTNADGSPDDVATQAICDDNATDGAMMTNEKGTKECYLEPTKENGGALLNNCKVRVSCSEYHATGKDSKCRREVK